MRESLESVLNQTYTNLEIIIVDDCSTDQITLDILKEFEQKDSRIKVIHSPENHGLGYTRNIGTEQITGAYLTYLDSDDRFAPDFIERMHKAITTNHTDFVLCNMRNFVLDERVPLKPAINWALGDQAVVKTSDFVRDPYFVHMPIRAYAIFMDASKYQQANMSFNIDLNGTEDVVWCTQMFLTFDTFSCLDYVGIDRLLRNGSIIHERSKQFYLCDLTAFVRRKDLLKQHGLFELQRGNFLNVVMPHVMEALRVVKDPEIKPQLVKMSTYLLEGMTTI